MTDTIRRTGRVTLTRRPDGRIHATVDASDLVAEILEALAAYGNADPKALTDRLDSLIGHRAEFEDAHGPTDRQWHADRMRDEVDELLAAADIAPDPSVTLGGEEVAFVAAQHAELLADRLADTQAQAYTADGTALL